MFFIDEVFSDNLIFMYIKFLEELWVEIVDRYNSNLVKEFIYYLFISLRFYMIVRIEFSFAVVSVS